MVENFEEDLSWKRFLFGSIGKKLTWAFGILFFFLFILLVFTISINNQLRNNQLALKNVEVPLEIMVEQVISYDSMLTGEAYSALLHEEKAEIPQLEEHKKNYDLIGVELDNLLKYRAVELINLSKRSSEDKNKVIGYLSELDKINLKLVDLETRAFLAMQQRNFSEARKLIVGEPYDSYKIQLSNIYNQWSSLEQRISEEYRQKILKDTQTIYFYNFSFGIIFFLLVLIIPFFLTRSITTPIRSLTMATKEITKGNFEVRAEINTGDELEELGKAFNKSTEQLQRIDNDRKQIDKAKTEFLSITSHELRSPMTPMKAQLQMVLGDYFGKLNNEQKESLKIVLNNTERLDKIIVDFLEISRIEAARLKFNFVRADLSKTIYSVIEEMKEFMPEKKIKIETHLEKLPIIEADPDRVSQVLRNLVNNAIKFTPENGKIEISAKMYNGMILFSVKDSGIGIAEKDQRKLFEPFYQVDNMYQHKSGGTGLGLAISRGIVESQNGKIWLNSQPGKGTIFYFTVPLKPVRDIRAIRLLFSESAKSEEEIKNIFKEYIGPLGTKEFENLFDSKGITAESVKEYISYLTRNKIITHELGEEFKNKVLLVFNRGVSVKLKENDNVEKVAKSFFERGKHG